MQDSRTETRFDEPKRYVGFSPGAEAPRGFGVDLDATEACGERATAPRNTISMENP